MMTKHGFTLIELLVSLTVFAVLSLFVTQSFLSILQARSKADVAATVRQEAHFALLVVERHLRGAVSATCTTPTEVSWVNADGNSSSFSCVNPGLASSHLASGSARLTSDNVSISRCEFSCPAPSQVNISFTITQRATTQDPRQKSELSVSSQVILRNQ